MTISSGNVVGVRYTYPTGVYPRYKYFEERLMRLKPRFQRITDAGNLSKYVSQGTIKFKYLLTLADQFQEPLCVTVFCDEKKSVTDIESKLVVTPAEETFVATKARSQQLVKEKEATKAPSQQLDKGMVSKEPISFESFRKGTDKITEMLVICFKNDPQVFLDAFGKAVSSFSQERLKNIVVYNEDTNVCYSYEELARDKFQVNWNEGIKTAADLSLKIQHILEDNVVAVLEQILEFISKFIPRKGSEMPKSLLDEVNSAVQKSQDDENVLDDLLPEPKGSDDDFSKIIPETTLDKWETKFHDNLKEYFSKKSKVVVCDHLSKKYGIGPSLINEFLNSEAFDYEVEFIKKMDEVGDKLPFQKREWRAKFLFYTNKVMSNSTTVIYATEEYVKTQMAILTILMKLEFEIFGLLRRSKVDICATVPTYPKLPRKLQKDLLEVSGVIGCGTIYGQLVLHVSQKSGMSESSKEEVNQLIEEHGYRDGYLIESINGLCETSDPDTDKFTHGDKVVGRLTQAGRVHYSPEIDEKCGTLGCFVEVTEPQNGSDNPSLHGITCAHVIKHCDPNITIHNNRAHDIIGTSSHYVDKPEHIDIAAIKVHADKQRVCNKAIRDPNNPLEECRNWSFLDIPMDEHEGLYVYKSGCSTGFTQGIIVTYNYMSRLAKEELNVEIPPETSNILVAYHADIPEQRSEGNLQVTQPVRSTPFSDKGDSGAVVCCEYLNRDLQTPKIGVVSLIQSGVTSSQGIDMSYLFSYTCPIIQSIEALRKKFGRDCTIEPACESEGAVAMDTT